eukprot:SAG11_NODE_5230_length_1622_cov_1.948785_1_plen_42_part_10
MHRRLALLPLHKLGFYGARERQREAERERERAERLTQSIELS